ncbi:hypothetical protein AMELA_G00009080 [Ameiurus melas]|uniref:Uncharacterized protein n=1 Tax=Ameiurus melas TaxID=219545 RepID=A0A7J6BG14_AMEME|nr:hypothetical protein AMELA_G00009080 [Ameiurus melas]
MLSEKQLTTDDCLDYMYYLQALVILKHLQRPGVVTHMTLSSEVAKQDHYFGIHSCGCQGAQDECSTSGHICSFSGAGYLV